MVFSLKHNLMNYLFFCLALVACLCVSSIYLPTVNAEPAHFPRVVAEEAFSSEGLHIIGVDGDNDRNLRWATWGKRSERGMSVVLALLRKTKSGVSIVWSIEKRDAYGPEVTRISDWRYGRHPLMAFTYQYGAAAEQAELYGLDSKNLPVKVAEMLGEEIDWSINSKGQGLMNVYSKPKGRMAAICYRWNAKQQRLEKVSCQ
jgi:hypothetical protein